MNANAGMVPIYKYEAVLVPSQARIEAEAAAELDGRSPSAQRFAERLNELAAEGKAAQLMVFPGVVLVGAIVGTMMLEQTIMPGVFAGAPAPAPRGAR
jgi:hypothetical protein